MEVPYQYLLGCTSANTNLSSERSLLNEVVWPAHTSFEALIRQFVLLFMMNDGLETLQLTCLLKADVQEHDDEHLVQLTQHVKLSTMGPMTEPIEDKDFFVMTHVPLHRMGTGTFTLSRAHPKVQEVFKDPASPEVAAHCLLLANEALGSFKAIRVERIGGQLLSG
jgi:hypothetical protein